MLISFSSAWRPPASTLFPYTTLFRSTLFSSDGSLPRQARWETSPPSSPGTEHARRRSHLLVRGGVRGLYLCRLSALDPPAGDRKSTRLNSSHVKISYAVFCLKKKTRA